MSARKANVRSTAVSEYTTVSEYKLMQHSVVLTRTDFITNSHCEHDNNNKKTLTRPTSATNGTTVTLVQFVVLVGLINICIMVAGKFQVENTSITKK